MAASDAMPVPKKNVAYRFSFAIRKPSDSTLITTWTGADSEVSKDGAAYADCTNEATEIGTSGTGYIDLTADEMNCDCLLLKVTVTNTGAVPLVFAIYPEEAGDYRAALINGAHGGSAATLTFERMIGASTTTNEPALKLTGNGTGAGLKSTGGVSGNGIYAQGGSTTGNGLYCEAVAGSNAGIYALGFGAGAGVRSQGGTTGNGWTIIAGATSGYGVSIVSTLDVDCIVGNSGTGKLTMVLGTDSITSGSLAASAVAEIAAAASTIILPVYGTIQSAGTDTNKDIPIGGPATLVVTTDQDISAETLTIIAEDRNGTNIFTIANGSITKTSTTITFTILSTYTDDVRSLRWTCRNASNVQLLGGWFNFIQAAK